MSAPPPLPIATPKKTNGCFIVALVVAGLTVLSVGGCFLFVGKVARNASKNIEAQIAAAAEPVS